jgi:serine/threonine-protein kinase
MAEVYLGRHTTLNRPVAVKILHAHLSDDDKLLARFRSEAQAVAGMRHPNIVQIFDFDVSDRDRPYIVMELLEGPALKEYLAGLSVAEQRLPLVSVVQIITALGSALDYAHARGIVHRDVKPANVVLRRESGRVDLSLPLSPDVEPVLTDFGVARMADAGVQTASGVIVGTPAYMSPEQVRGERVDHRSDIYALGIMLYEMLAGKLPFDGETQASILVRHLTEIPAPLTGVSAAVQQIVDIALAKDPNARFQSAGELAAALQQATGMADSTGIRPAPRFSAGVEDTAETVGMFAPSEGRRMASTPSARPDTQAGRDSRLNPIVIGAGIGALALAVVVGIIAVTGGFSKDSPAAETTPGPGETTNEPGTPGTEPAEAGATASQEGGGQTSEPIDLTTPLGSALFQDNTFSVSLAGVAPAPDGFVYEAWLVSESATPLSLGLVEVTGGQADIIFSDPAGSPLVVQYDGFALSLEPAGDADPAPSGTLAYRGLINPEVLQRVRALYTHTLMRDEPFATILLEGAKFEAAQYTSHLGFSLSDIGNANLVGGKLHAEHAINIVSGASDTQNYADWNGDGRIDNPGDDVGLEPYLLLLADTVRGAAGLPGTDDAARQKAEAILVTIDDLLQVARDARRLCQRVTSADTIAEVQPFAAELSNMGLESAVAALVHDASAFDLFIAVDVFAVAR